MYACIYMPWVDLVTILISGKGSDETVCECLNIHVHVHVCGTHPIKTLTHKLFWLRTFLNLPKSNTMHKHYHPTVALSWNWGTRSHVKYPLSGMYSTESIKIQHNQPLEFDGFGFVGEHLCQLVQVNQSRFGHIPLPHLAMLEILLNSYNCHGKA